MVNKIIPMIEKSKQNMSNHKINWQMKTFPCMGTAAMCLWLTGEKRKITLMSKLERSFFVNRPKRHVNQLF